MSLPRSRRGSDGFRDTVGDLDVVHVQTKVAFKTTHIGRIEQGWSLAVSPGQFVDVSRFR
jgi:hypothetical protein